MERDFRVSMQKRDDPTNHTGWLRVIKIIFTLRHLKNRQPKIIERATNGDKQENNDHGELIGWFCAYCWQIYLPDRCESKIRIF